MASTSGPGCSSNSLSVPLPRSPKGPATTTVGSASASTSGVMASPVSSTPGSNRTTTWPAPASMPALTAVAKPTAGSSVTRRRRSAARDSSQPAMRASPELSTSRASKSALVWVNTESSQRSTSGRQPWTTTSSVTARTTRSVPAWAGAFSACSSLPSALSRTSHPPARSFSRMASAAAKSLSRRSRTRSATSSSASVRSALALLGFDRGRQRGDDLERVPDHAKVGHLHDRGLGVLVDGDDHLGRLHPHRVLHGAGDADRDVNARAHGLARLADLHRVRHPAGVYDGAAGAHGAAERVRKRLEQREGIGSAHAAPPADDDLSVFELHFL